MANKKLKIGVLFGGKSAEHDVSLQSAKNVIGALDKNKYEVIPIGIDKKGKWILGSASNYFLNEKKLKLTKSNEKNREVALYAQGEGVLTDIENSKNQKKIDVVFPVMHGPFGEDGSIQGLLKLAGVPFVGAGVLGSAVGMDKDVMKRLLRDAGIPIGKFIALKQGEKISFENIKKELGMPMFIKPANMGSSVGINKAKNKKEFEQAVKEAFLYDTKIVVEKLISQAQSIAIATYKALECEGMARIDLYLQKGSNKFIVCEINTIPGFTSHSMYPKLWEASGVPQSKLLDKLISLAMERFKKEQKLKSTV